MADTVKNRYEFVYLFDVENGNPNGDPDAGNMPRIDPETNYGIITDVCLKRKVRNYVEIVHNNESPYKIYVREKAILNLLHKEAHEAVKSQLDTTAKRKGSAEEVEKARDWMCRHYFDVRTFGAVMSTEYNCGQVRGPVQVNFARSLDPIMPLDISITRMAVATEKEAEKQQGDNRTMGRKQIVPYGLYRAEGYISGHLARQTGFTEADLELFFNALEQMFDHDHSAARGKMSARKLYVFKHSSPLGNAPAHQLFDLIKVERKNTEDVPPRSFSDYSCSIQEQNLPQGVELIERL
ncbi:MAG TPA: type I-C CRISPR-associated protein Cas7/Csd2 [Candidatus Mcinerneyibacteriales bacterium]|nr:type I-C CRISPR-associated protein Cas7/Csd2 [Candidatus Mcinerneyibacteriales bacterium]